MTELFYGGYFQERYPGSNWACVVIGLKKKAPRLEHGAYKAAMERKN